MNRLGKVGQIYKQENGEIFVISCIEEDECHLIYSDGYTASYSFHSDTFGYDKLIAEYPTWQEAVNSKEFNGEKLW